VSALFAVGAIGCLAFIWWLYRAPASVLTISLEEIWHGRIDQRGAGTRIKQHASARLAFRQIPWRRLGSSSLPTSPRNPAS
jgi:hypothetical protein